MNRIKVLIADDHQEFARSSMIFLDRLPNVSVVGEASNGDEALKKVGIAIPGLRADGRFHACDDGLEATRIIKQRWPATKVLIATNHDNPIYRKQAMEAHADGFILKNSLKPSLEATFGDRNARVPFPTDPLK